MDLYCLPATTLKIVLYSDWKVHELIVWAPGIDGAVNDPKEVKLTQPPPPPPEHEAIQVWPPNVEPPVVGCTVLRRIVPVLFLIWTLISIG